MGGSPISEKDVTRAIVSGFNREFLYYVESDVIIVGAVPSGLIAAKRLAEEGMKTLVIESNNHLGGGFWIGGYLMNKLTIRSPAQSILERDRVLYDKLNEGLDVGSMVRRLKPKQAHDGEDSEYDKFDDVVLKHDPVVA